MPFVMNVVGAVLAFDRCVDSLSSTVVVKRDRYHHW